MKWLTNLLRRVSRATRFRERRGSRKRDVIVVTITESLRREATYVSVHQGADVNQICFPAGYVLKLSELIGECFRLSGYEILSKECEVSHGDRITRWVLGDKVYD